MKYLLDTHTFLWFINGDKALSATAQSLIEDPSNEIFLSIASIWEMAIKVSLGKLTMPQPFTEFVLKEMQENNINIIKDLSLRFPFIIVTHLTVLLLLKHSARK
jgi:PIN domain nuclease of toxin-antitoxin system